jgi:phosphohistidine swiveling domain-containing protein
VTPVGGMENPLHWRATDAGTMWSGGNVAEAIPGVSTALNWSFIGDPIELASRQAFRALGVLRAAELCLHDTAEERFIVCFYGRTTANIEMIRRIGDRMPGTSANAMEAQLFGSVRPDAENHNTLRRAPFVLAMAPRAGVTLSRRQAEGRRRVVALWRRATVDPPRDRDAALALLAQARDLYTETFTLGLVASMLAQSIYDQVVALARESGRPGLEHELTTGYEGMLETELLGDLRRVAVGALPRAIFLERHGYHGPREGQLSGQVWREDASALDAVLAHYADREQPDELAAAQRVVRERAEAELLASLPPARRPATRLLLRIARAVIPQREIGKANYTQCLDCARLAARAYAHQTGIGEDVFHLTLGGLRTGARDVDANRALYDDYRTTELPGHWVGPPVRRHSEPPRRADAVLRGQGAGGGAIIGRVRVVDDPAVAELEQGEILVCRITDPSWAPLFYVAGGVAIDLGGAMSHGAIVGRELGIPCVTSTGTGTRQLISGDHVRLDGTTGTIEILEPA